jgi:hypothetical protein
MKSSNMILHCGAGFISRDELDLIETPKATETWTPIRHGLLIDGEAGSDRGDDQRD